jgi:hypothetical protein
VGPASRDFPSVLREVRGWLREQLRLSASDGVYLKKLFLFCYYQSNPFKLINPPKLSASYNKSSLLLKFSLV